MIVPDEKPGDSAPIVLMTDFGDTDPFVGQMKGVISSIAPRVPVIDLTHKVPAHRVDIGAMFLDGSREYFPAGTIFVAVVDPGVGTSRRALLVSAHRQFFLGPDNGLLFPVTRTSSWRGYQLENPKYRLSEVSSTFHGRDVFAPAAAHLARGVPLESFGRKVSALTPLSLPRSRRQENVILGEVIHVDAFGNAWTNIARRDLQQVLPPADWQQLCIVVGETEIRGISRGYLSGSSDAPVTVINSFNLMEIAWPEGSASSRMGLTIGTRVAVWLPS